MTRLYIFTLLILSCLGSGYAQYQFDSKKAEKLYEKLNKSYEEYDYSFILENEDNIREYYLNKEDTVAATMNSFLAEAYAYELEAFEKAIEFYKEDLRITKKFDNSTEKISVSTFQIGYLLDQIGRYSETEVLYTELLEMEAKEFGKNSETYWTSLFSLADHYMFTEESEKGLKVIDDVLNLAEKGSYNQAISLKTQGDLLEMNGDYSKSLKSLFKALSLFEELGYYGSMETVYTLTSIAGTNANIGKLNIAEEYYREALSVLSKLPEDHLEDEMRLQGNYAIALRLLGDYEKAEKLNLELLAKSKENFGDNSPFHVGVNSYDLAVVYMDMKEYSKSIEYFNQAGSIFENAFGKDNLYYVRVQQKLTNVYTQLHQLDKAIELGEAALEITNSMDLENLYQVSFANFYLGNVYMMNGETDKAKRYHETALNQRKKNLGSYHPDFARSTNKMATINWKIKDFKRAAQFYEETFENYFEQINTVFPALSEEEKSTFYYNNLKPTFEQYNSFIVETSNEKKELIGKMYDNQLATKGLIFYATNKVREAILSSADTSLIHQYDTWISQKEQLAKLFSAAEIPVEERNHRIDSLNIAANLLEKELSKASSAFAQTYANRNITWKDVQAQLKPEEAAIEIIRFRDFTPDSAGMFTDEVYYAALIVTPDTKDQPELVVMKNGKQMETKFLSNYRNAIKYKVDEDFSYSLFWRPIAHKLKGIKKIYFSPDGVYNQISIYTLRNPETGNFTLDELEIELLTNTKDLIAFNNATSNGSKGKSYLFGYPNYNMGAIEAQQKSSGTSASDISEAASEGRGVRGVRGSRGAESEASSISNGGSIPRGLRGNMLRYMSSNQLLALLPGTKKEVNLIDNLYEQKHQPVALYLSNNALEDSIKTVRSPKTLHIATHGFFLENSLEGGESTDSYVQNPLLRSGLILAGANSFIAEGEISHDRYYPEDGILTAYEAMNLNLDHTELVVLSACETGLGEIKNGEGVYGLQRAFQVAGAEAVIMSMWTVDDDATQELMTTFYEEWLGGADKQTAFISAQKKLKDKWKSPYYWGAFVMIGH